MSFPGRRGHHAALLGRMLRRCGVDVARLPGEAGLPGFVCVARRCMACTETERCRRWLAEVEGGGLQQPPNFCPNAERLRLAVPRPA